MRTALCMAIGFAIVVGGVPASLAQDWRPLSQGKSAGTALEGAERQTLQRPGGNKGISIEVPIGTVSVGPDPVGGEPVYVRRTKVGEGGITVVEVSTTPFTPVLPANTAVAQLNVRPDQPAGW